MAYAYYMRNGAPRGADDANVHETMLQTLCRILGLRLESLSDERAAWLRTPAPPALEACD